jgi:glycogenin glucosyltransferase
MARYIQLWCDGVVTWRGQVQGTAGTPRHQRYLGWRRSGSSERVERQQLEQTQLHVQHHTNSHLYVSNIQPRCFNGHLTSPFSYAPAYQRFGSQISVVHFIGPHKPWHSIPYPAPGSSAQSTDVVMESSTETPATQQRAYDYCSLVDRWHSVYGRHDRSQAAELVFQPSRYTSAWNEGDRNAVVAGGALGLEELRRAALEGMGASGISVPRAYGDGEYRTMPLEGRFDLICPRTRAERDQVKAPNDCAETPESTPVPEKPSTTATTPEPTTPVGQILALPLGSPVRWTTLPTPGIHEIPPAPHARLISLPATPLRYVPTPYRPLHNTREAGAQTVPIQSQQRESGGTDLPLAPLMWNSAVEIPPGAVTPAPTDTYFPKAWDIDHNWSSISPSSSDTSLTTISETSSSKPRPPPNAVVSPSIVHANLEMLRHQGKYRNITREENGSPTPDPKKVKRVFPWEERPRTPGRVFPDERSPLTALPHHPATATPERKAAFRSPMPSPLIGFPPSLRSHHPSDRLLQRHVGGVPWPVPSSSPLGPENGLDRVETTSQDGDVEDEVDSEEETMMRLRLRSSSIEMAKRTLKYRSIGVQTDPRDLREEGIQVTTFVPVTEVAEKLILMNKRLGRNWVTSPETTSPSALAAIHLSTSSPLFPPNLDSLTTPVSDEAGVRSPSSPPVNSSVVSAGGAPFSHARKGSRVWDPARGVENFKRGSAEVLAKFMKIGSLEERT